MEKIINKKTQGLSINTIIIAAIALATLVIMMFIFIKGTGKTSENLGSCIAKGGKCANDKGECVDKQYPIPIIVSGECDKTIPKNLCCIKAAQ